MVGGMDECRSKCTAAIGPERQHKRHGNNQEKHGEHSRTVSAQAQQHTSDRTRPYVLSFGNRVLHVVLTVTVLLHTEDQVCLEGRASVFCLPQVEGSLVTVPVGWPHCVLNCLPCCKLAWDFLELAHISSYLAAHRDICCPLFTGADIAQDYMACAPILSIPWSKLPAS